LSIWNENSNGLLWGLGRAHFSKLFNQNFTP
jgi:hypothetical protein